MTQIRGVVFWDFDETLAYRDGGWTSCLHRIVVSNGISTVTMDDLRPHLKRGFPWHSPERPHSELLRGRPWWDYMHDLLTSVLVKVGIHATMASALAAQVRQEYLNIAYWHLYPDTLDGLSAVRKAGYHNHILSNHVPELVEIVHGLCLTEMVSRIFSSALLGFEKPHPRIFEIAREAVGPFARYFMVGDSFAADVAGANACGVRGILVRKHREAGYPYCSDGLRGVVQFLG